MRFLPVFLDLQRGVVMLVGSGELVRAKLRLLVSAGARVRWYATDSNHDLAGLGVEEVSRIEFAAGDPLTADLSGVIAVLCAGAGDRGPAMSSRARAVGLPVNVMDDLEHSTFIFPAIVDRGDVVVAVGTGGASPVVARRVRERIEAMLPARIGELAGFVGRWRKAIHGRIPELALRRRFWERVVDGPIGALILAGRKDEAESALFLAKVPTNRPKFLIVDTDFYRHHDSAAMNDALSTIDQARRKRDYVVVQQQLTKDVPTIIIDFARVPFVYNSDLKGFDPSPVISAFWDPWNYSI